MGQAAWFVPERGVRTIQGMRTRDAVVALAPKLDADAEPVTITQREYALTEQFARCTQRAGVALDARSGRPYTSRVVIGAAESSRVPSAEVAQR